MVSNTLWVAFGFEGSWNGPNCQMRLELEPSIR